MWRPLLLVLCAVQGALALVGTNVCNDRICIQATRGDDVDTYTIHTHPDRPIPPEKFGWIAIGWGLVMPNSPLVIMWPNEDGTFTLSQRKAPRHVMPSVDHNPPRPATLNEGQTWSNTTGTSLSFQVPSDSANNTIVIWALSNTRPDSTNPTAGLIQHTWHGGEIIDFTTEYSDVPGPTTIGYGASKATNNATGGPSLALIAHITCGVLVTMLVLPGGVVVPRITRGITTTKSWFYFHMLNQGFFALALVSINLGIGLTFGGEIDSAHRRTGTALFVLVILQIILGFYSHFYKPGHRMKQHTFETKRGRGPTNFLHVAFGIITVAVGWSACWSGFTVEWTRRGHGVAAYGFRVGWGMIVMLWIVLYILGLIFFLPRQLKIESAQRATDVAEQKRYFPSEFDLKVRNQALTPSPPMPLRGGTPSTTGFAQHSPTFSSELASPEGSPSLRTSFSSSRLPRAPRVQPPRKPSDPFADRKSNSIKGGHF
ncbi:hypothetical protein CspHIS471_0605310 [Cutaneotrichosporon sp. HIS471]|nr:hypothetical protein CspHIS471_0605310 [Cutaneotrichosporon sp. HIS471]